MNDMERAQSLIEDMMALFKGGPHEPEEPYVAFGTGGAVVGVTMDLHAFYLLVKRAEGNLR